ncbi:MAG: hypothetical protein UY63_C0004G0039 [Parcubacteria group bacterium GW2011_GWA2_51_10]|nr:MAG: hypothetical protein UY63_C0004G0039 [Parcubacteria group bacterium GW2011_GWA2_51_10]
MRAMKIVDGMHNLEVAGASPAPATRKQESSARRVFAFEFCELRGQGRESVRKREFPVEEGRAKPAGKPWVSRMSSPPQQKN